jgi:transposase
MREIHTVSVKGVKPICPFHQIFKSTYLFGAFSPINGDMFLLEMPLCNKDTFQNYLNEFSLHNSNEFKVVVLDIGAFHKAKSLVIPENIALIFLPPFCPELNPEEKIWAQLKRNFTNRLFYTLDQLSVFIQDATNTLSKKDIISTRASSYISNSLIWTPI